MNARNVWDLSDYHCPLVGTCLSTSELRKLAGRIGLLMPPEAGDYELHGAFVTLMRKASAPARYVQKYLDRKFARQMKRFARLRSGEEFWSLWTEMADAGDIPGAFWAVARHAHAGEAVLARIYGEVHMLSHLVGASTRADLRRLAEAQARVEKLTAALAERKTVLREAVAVWKRRTLALERDLARERARREEAEREGLGLREMLERGALSGLEREREALAAQLEQTRRELEALRADSRRQAWRIEAGYRQETALGAALAERDREVAALELALARSLADGPAGTPCGGTCDDPAACPCPRLRGKCVLYVGGRSGLKSQYCRLGERFGCRMLHHDGGLEQSPRRLHELLVRADAVVCPVDCVSHDACELVKRLCLGGGKPVHFARSSGLSSLASSLTELDRRCQ